MDMDDEKTGFAQKAVIFSLVGVGALLIILAAVFYSLKKEMPAPPLTRVTPAPTLPPQTAEETLRQSVSAPEGTPAPIAQEIVESLTAPTPAPLPPGARATPIPTPVPQSILDSLSAPSP